MGDKFEIKIKGHEKFVLREGWLTKGLLAVRNNPRTFSEDNGPDILGVGSNMVKAIRYYLQAFDLVNESIKNGTTLNDIGLLIVQNDPYIEDYFTLCLLHSRIAKNERRATTWYLFFNQNELIEFSKADLQNYIRREIYARYGKEVPESSIKDDVDVMLNMYEKNDINTDPEDKMNSPFSSLQLIGKEKDTYIKQQPDMKKIGVDTVLYEVASLIQGQNSINIENISEHLENIFNIPWVQTNEMLDILDREEIIRVDRTAGLDVIYPIVVPTPEEVIENHYRR
jgi:hypothetical protein